MKNQELETQLSDLLHTFPKDDVLRYYLRKIVTPLGYLNPKYFTVMNFTFINAYRWNEAARTIEARKDALGCEACSDVLVKRKMPTYFLAEGFLESVERTDFLENFSFSQLHFPQPGFLLVLPHGFTLSRISCNIPFVMVSTLEGVLYIHSFVLNDDGTYVEVSNLLKYRGRPDSIYDILEQNKMATKDDNSTIHVVNTYMLELILKLLIIISTKPNAFVDSLDESPVRQRRERRNGNVTDALWQAAFIGGGYSAQREDHGGIGTGKRMHWRRGHLRNQRYGENRLLVKPVWIEPMLIHGELAAKTLADSSGDYERQKAA